MANSTGDILTKFDVFAKCSNKCGTESFYFNLGLGHEFVDI